MALDIKQLGKQLVGLHAVAALATGIEPIRLEDNEGQALASAIVDVANQYNVVANAKMMAWLALAATAAAIYGPRALMIRAMVAEKKRQAEAVDFNGLRGVPMPESIPQPGPNVMQGTMDFGGLGLGG